MSDEPKDEKESPNVVEHTSQKSSRAFRIALIQLMTLKKREDNVDRVKKFITEAAENGAKMVVLPELFTCVLHPPNFIKNKESIPGDTTNALSELARQHGIYIVSGSMPETIKDSEKLYNTCNIFDPKGDIIQQHRKVHLFDVNLGPGLEIRESDIIEKGDSLNIFETDVCKVGVGICTDMRYPEVARIYADQGCRLIIYMCAFNAKTTGPAQWEVIQRARAIDNQLYVATCAPGTYIKAPYASWGHSSVTGPWGNTISTCEGEETIVYADIDMDEIDDIRRKFPYDKIRRDDLYSVNYLGK